MVMGFFTRIMVIVLVVGECGCIMIMAAMVMRAVAVIPGGDFLPAGAITQVTPLQPGDLRPRDRHQGDEGEHSAQ